MPRRSKGAHLWLRPARRKGGRMLAKPVWIIIDGKQHIATGCLEHQTGEAEKRLADYIADKYRPARHMRELEVIDVADVLSVYLDDCGPRVADQPKLERAIARLNNFWGGKMLSEITSAQCREPAAISKPCVLLSTTTERKTFTMAWCAWCFLPREPPETDGSRARRPLVCSGPVGVTARRKQCIAAAIRGAKSRPRSGRFPSRSFHPDRTLYRHTGGGHCFSLTHLIVTSGIPSWTSIREFSSDKPSVGARARKGNHLPPFPHACWNTCGAGFAEALLPLISSNGTVHQLTVIMHDVTRF
jgi:hypothetical protein